MTSTGPLNSPDPALRGLRRVSYTAGYRTPRVGISDDSGVVVKRLVVENNRVVRNIYDEIIMELVVLQYVDLLIERETVFLHVAP